MHLTPLTASKKYLSAMLVLVSALLLGLIGFVASLGSATASARLVAPVSADSSMQAKLVHSLAPSSQEKQVRTLNMRASDEVTSTARLPLDLVIVLDASGSMNWTWDGYGSVSDATSPNLRQYADANGNIPCARLLYLAVGCQSSEAYKDYTQRRIYLAKQAIKCYLDSTPWLPDDRVALVTYNGGYNVGPGDTSTLTHVYPSAGLTNTITGPVGSGSVEDLLINEAASKNPGSSDPAELYTTIGASPGALGLKRAAQVLASASGGGPRQRAVIFFIDGLLNVYLDGRRSLDESINANYDPTNQRSLPINQAIQWANYIKDTNNPKNASIYVLALSTTFSRSGLERIASAPVPPYLTSVSSSADLCMLLRDIQNTLTSEPTASPTSTATIETPTPTIITPTSNPTSEPTASAIPTSTAPIVEPTLTTTATLVSVNNATHNQFLPVIDRHP